MTNWRIITALAVLLAGCAGLQGTHRRDAASGYWRGEMDRMGWPEPFAVDIERDGEAFQGAWLSSPEVGSRPLENIQVQGDDVRFETDKLRFVGRISGDKLSGTVTEKPADAPVGQFVVTHEEIHNAGSEWSPAFLP